MKFVSAPWYANLQRAVMSSFISSFWITKFVRKNGINLKEYKKKKYTSFHDFFRREIKPESRPFTVDPKALLSPCDCKASVYEIADNSCFAIKGVPYTVDELFNVRNCDDLITSVRRQTLVSKYNGGYLFLLRLSLDDYHHYMYPVSGNKSADEVIPGKLYTVHPMIHDYCAVYRENARQFCSFAGLTPYKYDSGTSIRSIAKISKQSNQTMKALLHMSAVNVATRMKTGEYKEYYERKLKEGKHVMCIINVLRAKLVHRMFSVIRRNEEYTKQYLPAS